MKRARVLLADDHGGMLREAADLLRREHVVVGTAPDGLAAVSEAVRLRPDVVVLDISMPGLGGVDAARRIQEAGCGARIVFLTVHEDMGLVRETLASGALGYVVKSRLWSDLRLAVQEVLEGHAFVSPSIPREPTAAL